MYNLIDTGFCLQTADQGSCIPGMCKLKSRYTICVFQIYLAVLLTEHFQAWVMSKFAGAITPQGPVFLKVVVTLRAKIPILKSKSIE